MQAARRVFVVSSVFAGLLAGCTSPTLAPVTDRSQPAPQVRQQAPEPAAVPAPAPAQAAGTYTVAPGDTLYRIAKNHNVEVNDLMKANGITDPSKLAVGRVLTIPGAAAVAAPAAQTAPVPAPKVEAAPAAAPAAAPEAPAKPAADGVKTVPVTGEQLQWPVKGRVSKDFDAESRGIDIAAASGAPVLAAASGEVLLVTDKYKSYGNLVILRHGDGSFVTTYGQLQSIGVQKNEKVKAGQKIGTVGGANPQDPALHFEVRIAGKPVNPREYLR